MAFNPTMNSPVGTGNPYYGSGFMNFDRYLQDTNLNWGEQQPAPIQADSGNWSYDDSFDNWMINRAHPGGFGRMEPTTPQPLPIPRPPGPTGGGEAAPDTYAGPTPEPPTGPWGAAPPERPDWTHHVDDPRVPGGYDTYGRNPNAPKAQPPATPRRTAPKQESFSNLGAYLRSW